jgi:hypothetical protein
MHHLRSTSAVVRFRFAALLWLVICLLAPVAAGLLVQSVLADNFGLTLAGAGLAVVGVGLFIAQWAAGARTDCPLCWTPVLAPKACMKHRRAKTFLGSHRLRVALAILFQNQFRCPYCNESTALELPNSLHRPPNRWAQLD